VYTRSRPILTLVLTSLLGVSCGQAASPSGTPGVSSPSQAAPASSPVVSPSAATIPGSSAAGSTSPSQEAFAPTIGGTVVTVSDRLRVRSRPEVSDVSVKYEPLLPRGTELLVLEGPVSASGYVWYRVAPVSLSLDDRVADGWVALAATDGEAWIGPAPTPDQQPSSPLPSVAPGRSTTPGPISSGEPTIEANWQRLDGPPLDRLHQAYAAAWNGRNFVLAGIVERQVPERSEGIAFWTSPDGVAWTMGGERSAGWVNDFAFDPAGAGVAVGYLGSAVAAWSSPDGVRWIKVPDQTAFEPRAGETALQMYHVARTDDRFVAIGESRPISGKAVVLVSADGLSWARMPAEPAFSGVRLDDIVGADGHFVLVGHVRSPYRNVVWTSDDGRAWSEVPSPAGADPTDLSMGLYQVTVGPAGWLLTLSGSGTTPGRVWWSADGMSWAPAAAPGAYLRGNQTNVLATASGFVVVASTGGCLSGIYGSADARAWSCVSGAHETHPNATVAASDETIVTGDTAGEVWVTVLGD
jgi:hypothetical protein